MKTTLLLLFAMVLSLLAMPAFSAVSTDTEMIAYTANHDNTYITTDDALPAGDFAVCDVGKTTDNKSAYNLDNTGDLAAMDEKALGSFGVLPFGAEPAA